MSMSGLLRFLAVSMTDPVISEGRGVVGRWVVVVVVGGVCSSSMHIYYSKVFMYPVHVPSDEILWKIMLLQTSLLFSFVHRNIITHRQPYGVQWKESIVHATREGRVHIGPVVACKKKKNRALEASKVRDVSFLHFRLERNTSDCVYFLPEARHLL